MWSYSIRIFSKSDVSSQPWQDVSKNFHVTQFYGLIHHSLCIVQSWSHVVMTVCIWGILKSEIFKYVTRRFPYTFSIQLLTSSTNKTTKKGKTNKTDFAVLLSSRHYIVKVLFWCLALMLFSFIESQVTKSFYFRLGQWMQPRAASCRQDHRASHDSSR